MVVIIIKSIMICLVSDVQNCHLEFLCCQKMVLFDSKLVSNTVEVIFLAYKLQLHRKKIRK